MPHFFPSAAVGTFDGWRGWRRRGLTCGQFTWGRGSVLVRGVTVTSENSDFISTTPFSQVDGGGGVKVNILTDSNF